MEPNFIFNDMFNPVKPPVAQEPIDTVPIVPVKEPSEVEKSMTIIPLLAETYHPSRPKISEYPPVKESTEVKLARFVDTLNKVRQSMTLEEQDSFSAAIDQIINNEKKASRIRSETIETQESSNFWGFLKKVGTIVLSAVSIVIGGALCATGTPFTIIAGALLIGSGLTSITAMALSEAGVDPKVTGAISIVSSVLGFAGSALSFGLAAVQTVKLIATIATSVVNVGSGTTQIMTSVYQSKVSRLMGDKSFFDQRIAMKKSDLEVISTRMSDNLKRSEEATEEASVIVQALIDAKQKALRKSSLTA